jgi:transposase-like protein
LLCRHKKEKTYTAEEKTQILTRAAEIGVSKTAKEYGVPYATVAKWMSASSPLNTDIAARIEACGEEIEKLDKALKAKKAELKALQKLKAKEDKAAEKRREAEVKAEADRKAAEDREMLIRDLAESGKSVRDSGIS